MPDDQKYMAMALSEARKAAELGEIPIGAVLVLDGEVIAKAHNMRETWQDATAHAETIVIREACKKLDRWRLTGATLYVTIEPCPMCAGAIVMSRISRLVYGSPDSKAGAAESLFNVVNNPALNHMVDVTAGVCSEECTQVMKDFFKKNTSSQSFHISNKLGTHYIVKLTIVKAQYSFELFHNSPPKVSSPPGTHFFIIHILMVFL